MSEDKLLKFDVHLQATMVTGVGWGLEVTGILGAPPQQVFLIALPSLHPPQTRNVQVGLLHSGVLATRQRRMPLLGGGCSTARRN